MDALIERVTAALDGGVPLLHLGDRLARRESAMAALQALAARVQELEAALATVRAECDLPEHVAEIVGAALRAEDGEPS